MSGPIELEEGIRREGATSANTDAKKKIRKTPARDSDAGRSGVIFAADHGLKTRPTATGSAQLRLVREFSSSRLSSRLRVAFAFVFEKGPQKMVIAAQTCMALLVVLTAAVVLARRWGVPAPVLLMPIGLTLALVPGIPAVHLDPEIVLSLFLPPLIYTAAVMTSWPDFHANRRPILLMAVGCVLFTTAAVAVTAHYLIGMPWAIACVLGAVVSPPDAVAATAVAGRLSVPRRIITILDGEGMVNDATALIIYKFAIGAVIYGTFSAWHATGYFATVIVGETAWGIVVAWVVTWIRKWAHEARAEITISLLTPFLAYWPPEHLGGSGVLATVAAGLWISWNGWEHQSSAVRLQGEAFWDLVVFLAEGLLFLVTGLQAKAILAGLKGDSWLQLFGYTAAVCAVVIVVRFLWVFPATYLPRLFPSVRRREPTPSWRLPAVVSFSGMRGAISLAAALSIPLLIGRNDSAFPARDLIVFITYGVILVTLVGQGLLLPSVIRTLGVNRLGRAEEQREARREFEVRVGAARAALTMLDELAETRSLPEAVIHALRTRRDNRLKHLTRHREGEGETARMIDSVDRELLSAERAFLYERLRRGDLSDIARRRIEHDLDLYESRLIKAAAGH
jgi:CPA1 family monovalent cation:H+ antiporter